MKKNSINILSNHFLSSFWLFLIVHSFQTLNAQVNVSYNFDVNASGFTSNFSHLPVPFACTGSFMRRYFGGAGSNGFLISPLTGTSQGNITTISYDYKIVTSYPQEGPQSGNWGYFNVQFGATSSGPWTTVQTVNQGNHIPTADCTTKTVTFTPPAGALYIKFDSYSASGGFYLGFDNINILEAIPCVSPPAPGNTIAVNPVCSGVNFTLSTSEILEANQTYQWQSSSDGSFWNDIIGANNHTLTTSQTIATWYRCQVTCTGNTQASNPLLVTIAEQFDCYCSASYSNCYFMGITNVSMTNTTLNNTSPGCQSYTYFNPGVSSASLDIGSTVYTLNVTLQTNIAAPWAIAWIDYNRDGALDAVEALGSAIQPGMNNIASFTFTVPASASPGLTRLRIRSSYSYGTPLTASQACGSDLNGDDSFGGEVEDYDITLVASDPCIGTPTPGTTIASPTLVCSGSNVNFSLEYPDVGAGATFDWQSGPGSGGPWTSTGGTNNTYSAAVNTTTWYQCVVTCTLSGLSSNSTPVQVQVIPAGGTATASPDNETVSGCVPPGTTLSVTGYPAGAVFQWKSAATAGGPYTNISGATTATFNYFGISSDIYFVCEITACASIALSNEVFFDYNTGSWSITDHYFTGGSISIPGPGNVAEMGTGSPYPSTVNVSGLSGTVEKVVIQLCGLSHSAPHNVDMALVAPSGETYVFMADPGVWYVGWGNKSYTFDDNAATGYPFLLAGITPPNGTYRPMMAASATYSLPLSGTVNYPAGAGNSTFSSVFGGIQPNGTWSLFIYDDAFQDSGDLSSWTLGINTSNPCTGNTASIPPTSGTYTADYACPDPSNPDFINYFDDGGTSGDNSDDYLLLSIDKLTNPDIGTIGDGTFSVTVAGNQGASWITNPPANYVEDPLFIVMNRYWTVTPNCTTCASSPNIDADATVRFYFTQQDYDDVVSELLLGGADPLIILQNPDELFMYKINSLPGPYDPNPAAGHSGVPESPAYNSDGYWEYNPGASGTNAFWAPISNSYTGSAYGAEFTVAAFSGGGGGGGSQGNGALPIELLYFTGLAENNYNLIEWATASERNNQYQVVERSANGTDNWIEIGRKDGSASSTTEIRYQLADDQPLMHGYYRLRAIDYDGTSMLSDIINIQRESASLEIMSTYPVPVGKTLTITIQSPVNDDLTITISDLSGKLIQENHIAANAGLNIHEIDMATMASGTYQVTVSDGFVKRVSNIVKQ